jgi:hypothetical protein
MTRRWHLLAAALIVCVTNVVALSRGLLNRRNAPDGAITLTERELPIARAGSESTATILRLEWRSREDSEGFPCDKIRPLGFTCPDRPLSGDRRELRQPQRNGYVVLEYDGPAWQRLRKRREADWAQQAAQNPSLAPQNPWWLNQETRLVAIDVGSDADALRRSYPDASRYLIAMARIAAHPRSVTDSPALMTLHGVVIGLMPSTINVPPPLSAKVRDARRLHSADPPQSFVPRYTVTLRYGRFLEPWVVDIQP